MFFSAWPNFNRPWDDLAAFATHIDQGQWWCLWYADHYMGNTDSSARSDAGGLEAWAVMGALACHTHRVRIGTLVSPTTIHHPAILANRAATVDQISQGRLTLGLGAGWQINEHEAYGIQLFEAKDRVDRFEESIQILRLMFSEARTNFAGQHFTITDAPCEPKPVQLPQLPIVVGTSGPRMSRIAAKWADQWNVWGTPDTVAKAAVAMDRACEAEGRNPAQQFRSAQALVFMVDDDKTAEKIRGSAPADRSLIGSTSYLVDQIGRYKESGIVEFILPDFTLGKTIEDRIAAYDRFDAEVASQLR
jgi:alkanesulfonate monooxygenase SsuD/methylene tetrahydromethanopterin reductase-like flavin-dependent oxidoreductase (luciferase family)